MNTPMVRVFPLCLVNIQFDSQRGIIIQSLFSNISHARYHILCSFVSIVYSCASYLFTTLVPEHNIFPVNK